MKKNFATLMGVLALLLFTFAGITQKTLPPGTKSKSARELVRQGTERMKNIEFAQAYDLFQQAVAVDPDCTVALTVMSNLSTGQAKKDYGARAQKSAAKKSEGEKLFTSLVGEGIPDSVNRISWEKLREIYPDDDLVNLYYAFSRATPSEQLTAVEDYTKKFPNDAAGYNMLGYLAMQVKKDTALAKTYFEKYIQMYPQGCNPYDSMGEFYFMTGDMANSEKYYKMALEKYPFNISSLDKLKEIKAANEKIKSASK